MNKKMMVGSIPVYSYHTDKFKTATVKIRFPRPLRRAEITSLNLLANILEKSCDQYRTTEQLERHLASLYGATFQAAVETYGNNAHLSFTISSISPALASDVDLLAEFFIFLNKVIYHPFATAHAFNRETYNFAKSDLKNSLIAFENGKKNQIRLRLWGLLGKEEAGINTFGYAADLDKISNKQVYALYQQIINGPVAVHAIGDFAPARLGELVGQYVVDNGQEPQEFPLKALSSATRKRVTDVLNYDQSQIVQYYQLGVLKNSHFKDEVTAMLLADYLGGNSNSLLFLNLREKQHLCYTVSVSLSLGFGYLRISTGIDQTNIKRGLRSIKRLLTRLQAGQVSDKSFNATKENCRSFFANVADSYEQCFANLCALRPFERTDQEYLDLIEACTKKDLVALSRRLKLLLNYVLKGVKR